MIANIIIRAHAADTYMRVHEHISHAVEYIWRLHRGYRVSGARLLGAHMEKCFATCTRELGDDLLPGEITLHAGSYQNIHAGIHHRHKLSMHRDFQLILFMLYAQTQITFYAQYNAIKLFENFFVATQSALLLYSLKVPLPIFPEGVESSWKIKVARCFLSHCKVIFRAK